jgi:hypothetical protein
MNNFKTNLMKKICYRSDGTAATGAKIIKALEEAGGVNNLDYDGVSKTWPYFYIDNDSDIECASEVPSGYELKEI